MAEQVYAYTRPGELIFDPFCGRGTTLLESLLSGRNAIGCDINSVAACISRAKADTPSAHDVSNRIDELSSDFFKLREMFTPPNEFFSVCYHPDTFSEIEFLRNKLDWHKSDVDCFISAVMLGLIHGESHRSEYCLSNRMPRTISTKPDYSVQWWKKRGLVAPRRETFRILRSAVSLRFGMPPPERRGKVMLMDSRDAWKAFPEHRGRVALIVTSPPYFDTTDYAEDQWLRLWFLGGAERPSSRFNKDDRYTEEKSYWRFLAEIWQGLAVLLRETSVIVIRIGGTRFNKEILLDGLIIGLTTALEGRNVIPLHGGKTSRIANSQTNSFRPGATSSREEHDFAFSVG